jgi:hypothetical protein
MDPAGAGGADGDASAFAALLVAEHRSLAPGAPAAGRGGLRVVPNAHQARRLLRGDPREEVPSEGYEAVDREVARLAAAELERLYAKVAEARRIDDAEELMRVIRVITGQWRSGRLRLDGEDGLDRAFQGTADERARLEAKRRARNQRRARVAEERARTLHTAEDVRRMIDRVMWMQAARQDGASPADVYRGEAAMMGERDPRKEVLERLEMGAFLRERRAQEALR